MSVVVAGLLAAAVLLWPGRRPAGKSLAALVPARAATRDRDRTGPAFGAGVGSLDPGAAGRLGRRLRDRFLRPSERASPEQVLALLDGLEPALAAGLAPGEALRLQVGLAVPPGGPGPLDAVPAADSADPAPRSRWHAQLADLAARARDGEELASSWRELARAHRSPELLVLAQAWALSERLGSSLADAVHVTTGLLRERQRAARRVQAASAGARATMNLLTALPLGGVAVASLLGLSPVTLYTGSPLALISLAVGVALLGAGRALVRRMVRRSLQTGPAP